MRWHEGIALTGRLRLLGRDREGRVVEDRRARNSVVLSGRDLVAKLFIDQPIAPISHVAVGTGGGAVDPATDAALGAELFRKPLNAVDPATHLVTTSDHRRKVTLSVDLDFNEGNGALTEAGLFNAANGGVMYNRVTFPAVNKTSDFKLTLIWEVVF